jgi:hypothetical protein
MIVEHDRNETSDLVEFVILYLEIERLSIVMERELFCGARRRLIRCRGTPLSHQVGFPSGGFRVLPDDIVSHRLFVLGVWTLA